jgi:hypothetical protein
MPLVTPWPSVRQALIRTLRSNLVLAAELPGDWGEGFDPQDATYPLGVIALHYDPVMYDWTGQVALVGVDVLVFSKSTGEASRLAQLAYTSLHDARLNVSGQTSLSCRFGSGISLPDVDKEGKAVYAEGGVYEVRVAQSNPQLRTLAVTLDSTIA